MATEQANVAVPKAQATLTQSDDLKMLLAEYKAYKGNFVAIPDTVLTADILAKFGDKGTTAQHITYDFSNAKNASTVSKTEKNLGKKVGAVKCLATLGGASFPVRLSINQVESIIDSGNPTWETIVRYSENEKNPSQPWSNLEPVKAVA